MHHIRVHTDPDVYLIKVPFSNYKLDSTNCYAVIDEGETLVVDTGAPSEEGRAYLAAALEELHVDFDRTSFFLTHLHLDHAGLVDALVPPDAPLYLNERDYKRTQPEEVQRRYERLYRTLVAEGADPDSARCSIESRSQFSHIIHEPHRLVFTEDGDGIRVGSRTLRVVDTAGHTPGHQALYDPASGILFGGDHVLFVLSPSIGLFLPESGAPASAGDSVQTYLDNLEKVRALAPTALFHSHGPLREDIDERIAWLSEHQRERAERVLSLVGEHPDATGFEITKLIGFNLPHKTWEDVSCVQRLTLMEIGAAFLRHLELRGLVEARTDGDGIRRYRLTD